MALYLSLVTLVRGIKIEVEHLRGMPSNTQNHIAPHGSLAVEMFFDSLSHTSGNASLAPDAHSLPTVTLAGHALVEPWCVRLAHRSSRLHPIGRITPFQGCSRMVGLSPTGSFTLLAQTSGSLAKSISGWQFTAVSTIFVHLML